MRDTTVINQLRVNESGAITGSLRVGSRLPCLPRGLTTSKALALT